LDDESDRLCCFYIKTVEEKFLMSYNYFELYLNFENCICLKVLKLLWFTQLVYQCNGGCFD
jgi:hypothetical protein